MPGYSVPLLTTDDPITAGHTAVLVSYLENQLRQFVNDLDLLVMRFRSHRERVSSMARDLRRHHSIGSVPQSPLVGSMTDLAFSDEAAQRRDLPKMTTRTVRTLDSSSHEKVRQTLVELQFSNDRDVMKELRAIRHEVFMLLDALRDASHLFAFRMLSLGEGSQAKTLLQAVDESVSEVSSRVEEHSELFDSFLRSKADLEKTLIKHPTSEAALRLLQLRTTEIWDEVEDAYRSMEYDVVQLKFTFTKDLPVVAQVLSMEGAVGGRDE